MTRSSLKTLFGFSGVRLALLAAMTVGASGAMSGTSQAAGWTVYIWNMRTNAGWLRTGFTHDLYTSDRACIQSINRRIAENRRYRTDFEAFAIVYQSSRPPAGYLRSFIKGTIMYVPSSQTGMSSGKTGGPQLKPTSGDAATPESVGVRRAPSASAMTSRPAAKK